MPNNPNERIDALIERFRTVTMPYLAKLPEDNQERIETVASLLDSTTTHIDALSSEPKTPENEVTLKGLRWMLKQLIRLSGTAL